MSLVKIPGLGFLKGSAGTGTDVVVGGVLGLAGVAGVKFVVNKWLAGKLPSPVVRALPFLSGALTAGVLYFVEKKSQRAKSHAIGAVLAGAAINVWDEVRAAVPDLADLVSVRLSNYRGVLVDDSRLNGMIVDDSSRNLAELQAINMQPDDDY